MAQRAKLPIEDRMLVGARVLKAVEGKMTASEFERAYDEVPITRASVEVYREENARLRAEIERLRARPSSNGRKAAARR